MDVAPEMLKVVDRATDVARRRRFVVIVIVLDGLAFACLLYILRWRDLLSSSQYFGLLGLAATLIVIGFVVAHRFGVFARLVAMLRLPGLRAEGARVTEALRDGDLSLAKTVLTTLLPRAQPLGAFHATHVVLVGVVRHLEGATAEGHALVSQAVDSGWFDNPRMLQLRDASVTWQVLMLLSLGRLDEAGVILEQHAEPLTAASLVFAAQRRWHDVVTDARKVLSDAEHTGSESTIALLGAYAAQQIDEDDALFEAVLADHPPTGLVGLNPTLAPFWTSE